MVSTSFFQFGFPKYKKCLHGLVRFGGKLNTQFQVGNEAVGTLQAKKLPKPGETVVLVAQRGRKNLTAMTFTAHVFRELEDAEVVMVDAYRGQKAYNKVQLRLDLQTLQFGAAAVVKPGKYRINLVSVESNTNMLAKPLDFLAEAGGRYILMRIGYDDGRSIKDAGSFPQELVTYKLPTHACPKRDNGEAAEGEAGEDAGEDDGEGAGEDADEEGEEEEDDDEEEGGEDNAVAL